MYSRSAKGGEKGDPNRNPGLAKMVFGGPLQVQTYQSYPLQLSFSPVAS